MLTIEIEKLGEYSLPEKWDEVTADKFLLVYNIFMDITNKKINEMDGGLKLLSLLMEVPQNDLMAHLNVPSLVSLNKELEWMQDMDFEKSKMNYKKK